MYPLAPRAPADMLLFSFFIFSTFVLVFLCPVKDFWRLIFNEFQIFHQNHGLTPLEKCQFSGILKPMFLLSRKACLLYKTSKIVFSRFNFTIYNMRIQGATRGYRELQGVTRGYKRLQGVTGGDRGLQGLQGVKRIIQTFFLTRTFPDSFSWSILH